MPDRPESNDLEVTRRVLLQLVGAAGASVMLAPPLAFAGKAAPSAFPCPPPTGAIPDLPALAQLVDYLIKSKGNRQTFNEHSDEFLGKDSSDPGCFKLQEADRQALLSFNPPVVFRRIQDEMGSNASMQAWTQFYDLIYRTRSFWDNWKPGADDYPDTFKCNFEHNQQPKYAYPHPEVYDLIKGPDLVGGKNVVTISLQGVLDKFEVVFKHPSDPSGDVGPAGVDVKRDANSTFRCAQITASATLQKGEKYLVVIRNVSPPMTFAKPIPITAV